MMNRRSFLGLGVGVGLGVSPSVQAMTAELRQPPRSVLRHGEPMLERVFDVELYSQDKVCRESGSIQYVASKPGPSSVCIPFCPVCGEGATPEEALSDFHYKLRKDVVAVLLVAARQNTAFPEASYEDQVRNMRDHFGHDDIGYFEQDGWLVGVDMRRSQKVCMMPVLDPPCCWSKGWGAQERGYVVLARLGTCVLDDRVVACGRLLPEEEPHGLSRCQPHVRQQSAGERTTGS